MMKDIIKDTPLAQTEKNITNYSVLKTIVGKLRQAGFAKCKVKNITGQSREEGLDEYESGNDKELHATMSTTISKNTSSKTTLSLQNNNNFSFGIPGPE